VSDCRTNALSALLNGKGKLLSFLREWALKKIVEGKPKQREGERD